jgi:hypothetical protein
MQTHLNDFQAIINAPANFHLPTSHTFSTFTVCTSKIGENLIKNIKPAITGHQGKMPTLLFSLIIYRILIERL